mmetsp:Transcript_29850/g.54676  ORF Transcript_29850/g.54676 Transcript_29850/m.54676 type:complete len:532 (-) Transcript_29850:138-1733(-)
MDVQRNSQRSACWGYHRYSAGAVMLAAVLSVLPTSHGFGSIAQRGATRSHSHSRPSLVLRMDESEDSSSASAKAGSTSTGGSTAVAEEEYEDDDAPADVVGAKFFGGSAVKEELFDSQEEEAAALTETRTFDRFEDVAAFPDPLARTVAERLQRSIQTIIRNKNTNNNNNDDEDMIYAKTGFKWETPLIVTKKASSGSSAVTPLEELEHANQFYNQLSLAIVAAKSLSSDQVRVKWELGLVWPNPWESRLVLTGASTITLSSSSSDQNNQQQIVSQVDLVDGNEGLSFVGKMTEQVWPRFWDLYHVGMTPSAEERPTRILSKPILPGLLGPDVTVHELPPRLVLRPTILDVTNDRDTRCAQIIPNHAFSCLIKTMGPKKETYIPTTPIEVSIQKDSNGQNVVSWNIHLPAEFLASHSILPLAPVNDPETAAEQKPKTDYVFTNKRWVATMPYGGQAQDEEVADIRQSLYNAILKEGKYKPKLDANGRPQFVFWQYDTKACFTADGGLGMAVYEWRPEFVKSNAIGLELECQ